MYESIGDILVMADKEALTFALYSILTLGMKNNNTPVESLSPSKKNLKIKLERDRLSRELTVSVISNYNLFPKYMLEPVETRSGGRVPMIFKWMDELLS